MTDTLPTFPQSPSPVIIDGVVAAARVKAEVAAGICDLTARGSVAPGLAVVLVGDDPASIAYVRMKERDCAEVGIRATDYRLPADIPQKELNALIEELNRSERVHGVLVQLPLPAPLDEAQVIERIAPAKDVDGFGADSLGRLVRGERALRACTPAGVMRLLDDYGIDPDGKRAVVVGRSVIVGKPMALLLLERNATVTVCHSRTADLAALCREADLLVAAVGRPGMIDRSYVKPGAVVIDVGINRTDKGLVGDVDFADVAPITAAITPVPGGVGPMTRALLMANTLAAAQAQL
ncbi:MAG: bifunctional methylenetetrahydrofolate dehydrogenase/methenyltetrahydrofolate cyclohydrolase FolD [Actinomycetes bacterium]|jgi:methylenetetrahydrofolate dehydrogenase (NADP+)/methenyltetrahydrofolate cyclohydrolase|nr:bifunctional methylenetetrahydrofolate dehydrogenase/methenyltetrahydrofolate cyclohydrolase FolD [Actinomycetes bacterium]